MANDGCVNVNTSIVFKIDATEIYKANFNKLIINSFNIYLTDVSIFYFELKNFYFTKPFNGRSCRGKLNLQIVFYFANNTIVIWEHALLCNCGGTPLATENASDKNAQPPWTFIPRCHGDAKCVRCKCTPCEDLRFSSRYWLVLLVASTDTSLSRFYSYFTSACCYLKGAIYLLKVSLFSLRKHFFPQKLYTFPSLPFAI